MSIIESGVISGNIRPLPVKVRPRGGEGVRSFIVRLAHANHLIPGYLRMFLCEPPDHRGIPSWSRLAAVTGRDPDFLRITLETRHCLECGAAMPPLGILGRQALRCSQACRQKAYRRRHPLSEWLRVPCSQCGEIMRIRPGQRRHLCSSRCRRDAYLERQRRRQERSAQTEDAEPSPCPICERPLPPGKPSSRRRTCSQRCRQRAYRWRNAPPPHPVTSLAEGAELSSPPPSLRVCEVCSDPLPLGPNQAQRRTCSHRCRQQAYRRRVSPAQDRSQPAASPPPPKPLSEALLPPQSVSTCTVCKGLLPAGLGQARRRTCSHRCRQRAYRERLSCDTKLSARALEV
jgi:predicted nucleic acid-binding Zn ribbon protein